MAAPLRAPTRPPARGTIKATSGVWLNYATTLLFQIVFADKFGSGNNAALYVLVFSVLNAIGAVAITGGQAFALPRLLAPDGRVRLQGVRILASTSGAVTLALIIVIAIRNAFAGLTGHLVGATRAYAAAAIGWCAIFIILQVVAGNASTIALVRGARFLPAAAPAATSIAAASWLLLSGAPSVPAVFMASGVASVAQAAAFIRYMPRRSDLDRGQSRGETGLLLATAGQLALLSAVPPIERLVSGARGATSAAAFNYAQRSLAIGQQLVVGGLGLAALSDWSDRSRYNGELALSRPLYSKTLLACMLLSAAGALGIVLAPEAVSIIYARGAFSQRDVVVVSRLVIICALGFVGEGLSIVPSQALLAIRHNKSALRIGIFSGGLRIASAVILGILFGASGVAIGYSLTTILVLAILMRVLARTGLVRAEERRLLFAVVAACLAVVGLSAALRLYVGGPKSVVLILGCCVLVAAAIAGALRFSRTRSVSKSGVSDKCGALAGRSVVFLVNTDRFFVSHRLALAAGAKAEGMRPTVITRDTGHLERIEALGCPVILVRFERMSAPMSDLLLFAKVLAYCVRVRPAVMHLVATKAICLGGIAARISGVPAVVNAIAGGGYALGKDRRGLVERLVRRLLAVALHNPRSIALFQNQEDIAEYVAAGLVKDSACKLIRGQGVDVSAWTPGERNGGSAVVLLAARMIDEKGPRTFVEAARLLRGRGCNATFALAGPIDSAVPSAIDEEEIRAWASSGLITYLGDVSDMLSLLRGSTIVTLPSYHREGVPRVLIEAGACGKAIVATNIPGCRDVVQDGVTGLLIPPHDPGALANAIDLLLNDGTLRQRLGDGARNLVAQEFSEHSSTEATLEIYRELLLRPRWSGLRKAL